LSTIILEPVYDGGDPRGVTMNTKDKLLLYLKENRNNWVSGEGLSRMLEVSRSAINKHIHQLKQMGYQIETSTRKGYLLSEVPDLLLPGEIREGLDTRVFGAGQIVHFEETDSTNLRAKILAAAGAPEGTVVIAERQTRGRGRKGRSWFSPDGGGIYISLILRPAMPPGEAPRITLVTGVAAAEALLSVTPLEARIKWPNDILIKGKKIAGILTEISTEMDEIDHIVVGVGMNVNLEAGSLDEEIRETATSILIETGEVFPRVKLIRAFLKKFETCYEILLSQGFNPIRERWKELSDSLGRQITVDMIGRTRAGEFIDIDAEGVLILKDDRGEHHRIVSGDIRTS
jgi:BirA family biotin operon repressor/biotin-[acetyl-CoA-carboxylase] ligase